MLSWLSFSAKYLFKKVLTKDRTTGPRMIAKTPFTEKPGTSTAANQKQSPLTTNENNPKVRMFKGRDKIETVGLIKELTKPTAKPAIKAAGNVAIFTPGTTRSTISRLKAVANVVRKNPSISILQSLMMGG
jgi:hypothetical protein